MPKDQKKKTGRQNYDWAKIQQDYVTTPDMSLRKIAAKYGINPKTVYKKSKAEGWFATRKSCQAKVAAKGIAKTTNKLAKELSEEADFLQLMKGHMSKMLNDELQFQRQLIMNPITGETEERITEKFDSRAAKDSMQILQMMESMTRSLYNIQKAEAIQRHQIERERLELEKERLALERERQALRNGNMDADEERYGVVLMPEVLSDE